MRYKSKAIFVFYLKWSSKLITSRASLYYSSGFFKFCTLVSRFTVRLIDLKIKLKEEEKKLFLKFLSEILSSSYDLCRIKLNVIISHDYACTCDTCHRWPMRDDSNT